MPFQKIIWAFLTQSFLLSGMCFHFLSAFQGCNSLTKKVSVTNTNLKKLTQVSRVRVHVWHVLLKSEFFLTNFILDVVFESYNVNFFPLAKSNQKIMSLKWNSSMCKHGISITAPFNSKGFFAAEPGTDPHTVQGKVEAVCYEFSLISSFVHEILLLKTKWRIWVKTG